MFLSWQRTERDSGCLLEGSKHCECCTKALGNMSMPRNVLQCLQVQILLCETKMIRWLFFYQSDLIAIILCSLTCIFFNIIFHIFYIYAYLHCFVFQCTHRPFASLSVIFEWIINFLPYLSHLTPILSIYLSICVRLWSD